MKSDILSVWTVSKIAVSEQNHCQPKFEVGHAQFAMFRLKINFELYT